MNLSIDHTGVRHAGTWLDSHAIGDHALVIQLAENPYLAVDSASIEQRGLWLDHPPACEMPGVLPFTLRNLQSHEVSGFSQYRMLGGVQAQNVFSTATINDPGEFCVCADDDPVIFARPFRVAFTGGVGILPLGILSFGEGPEVLLLLGGCENIG
ncbi:hypothetical protein [Pseudomonas sp. A214]|uniref:hypothetical protein n=1 Tax=Pseudomonas sp. A214 TaxID=1855331 RepID=UPI001E5098AF|nr:hypothetical protein [Pseudomonas sp. A214]